MGDTDGSDLDAGTVTDWFTGDSDIQAMTGLEGIGGDARHDNEHAGDRIGQADALARVVDVQRLGDAGDCLGEWLVFVGDSDDSARRRDDAQDCLLVVPVDGELVWGAVDVDDTVSDGDTLREHQHWCRL